MGAAAKGAVSWKVYTLLAFAAGAAGGTLGVAIAAPPTTLSSPIASSQPMSGNDGGAPASVPQEQK